MPSPLIESLAKAAKQIEVIGEPAAQRTLLERLRSGQKWLTDVHKQLSSMDKTGRGTPLETRFSEGIVLWDSLDYALRFVYRFQGCIHGPGQWCPEGSPIICRGCSGG